MTKAIWLFVALATVDQALSLSNFNGLATSIGAHSMLKRSSFLEQIGNERFRRSEENKETNAKEQIFKCINSASK